MFVKQLQSKQGLLVLPSPLDEMSTLLRKLVNCSHCHQFYLDSERFMRFCSNCQEARCLDCYGEKCQCGQTMVPFKLSILPTRVQNILKGLKVSLNCDCCKESEMFFCGPQLSVSHEKVVVTPGGETTPQDETESEYFMIEESARLSIFDAQKHLFSAESKCPLSLTCNLCKGETFASINLLHRHLANDCPGVIEKCPGCKNLMTRATMKTSEHYECYCIGQESLAVKQNNPKELVKAF